MPTAAEIVALFEPTTHPGIIADALQDEGLDADAALMRGYGHWLRRSLLSGDDDWLIIESLRTRKALADVVKGQLSRGWRASGQNIQIAGCRTPHEAAREWLESYQAQVSRL
jgi:hypothetical protein